MISQFLKNLLTIIILISSSNCYLQITDSTHYIQYLNDRNYFVKLQETVSSKNQYIGLQWCIDLLGKYIELEERKFIELNK